MPFLISGGYGLIQLKRYQLLNPKPPFILNYAVFFAASILISAGSAYYHYQPGNDTLVWDRLPMTIAFMAFFSIVVGEHVSEIVGKKCFLPLLVLGLFSVVFWAVVGDLRLYLLVQFLPMLLTPLIVVLFRSPYSGARYMFAALFAYGLAKVLEYFDASIYSVLAVSGHSLKHIVSAIGVFYIGALLSSRLYVAQLTPPLVREKL